ISSSRPEREARSGETPVFALASTSKNSVILSGAQRSRRTPKVQVPPTPSAPSTDKLPPSAQAYTIGSPLSPIPVDPPGILATANARIAPDDYPYYISNNWADPYRVERINHLLDASV